MKIIKKDKILENDEIEHTKTERVLLQCFNHPFLVGLHYAFQSKEHLYLVMDYVNGGDLFYHLQKSNCFKEEVVKLYAAEIYLGLNYLHENNVIYRDLKPENVLLDADGHCILTDFGLAKILKDKNDRANTYCGSSEYLPPEVLIQEESGYSACIDWWSFGILIYELLCGFPPFFADNINEIYTLIISGELMFPDEIHMSVEVKDLISKLLIKDPHKRLGNKDEKDIRKHPFFKDINFNEVYHRKIKPSFCPNVKSPDDISNIDEEFLKMDIDDDLSEFNSIFQENDVDLMNSKKNSDIVMNPLHSNPALKNIFKGFEFSRADSQGMLISPRSPINSPRTRKRPIKKKLKKSSGLKSKYGSGLKIPKFKKKK